MKNSRGIGFRWCVCVFPLTFQLNMQCITVLSLTLLFVLKFEGVFCKAEALCESHYQCVPKWQCRWKNLDEQQHYGCGVAYPSYVCCPNSQVDKYGSDGQSRSNRYDGSKQYGGSNLYGGSHGHSGSSYGYGGSSNRYGHSSNDPHYMDFYHDQYEKYYGYTLSKQAKELLRNYRAKEECGVRNKSPADMARISSGFLHDYGFTSFGEFRWHVALMVKQRSYKRGYGRSRPIYRYHCGATLIHRSLLITAAHCVKGIRPRKLLAHLGDWNLQGSSGELFPAIKRSISSVFIHSGYNPGTYLNDIALLQMYEPINTYKTPHIGPICLPEVNYELADHSKCFIVGWGDDLYKPNFGSNTLKSVSVTYASDHECSSRLYASLKPVDDDFVLDTDSQKCILGAYGKDACVGDGGGGVVCPLSNDEGPDVCNTHNCAHEHYFLFGVISYGSPVCGEDSITIISDVVENLNWIYTILDPAGGLKNYNYHYYHKLGRPHRGRSAEVEVNATTT